MQGLTTFRRLTIATIVVGFLLIIVGGIVRVEGAGMGCGDDWPVCNGKVVPTFDYLTTLEYGHRVIAGIVLLLAAVLAFLGWRMRRIAGWLLVVPALALGLVVAQALLGAVTVFVELEPEIVTAHLGMAQAYIALMIVLGLLVYRQASSSTRGRPRTGSLGRYTALAAGAVFLLMLTGAYTATSPAAWACPEWPGCHGNYVPTGTSPVDIHLLHRWMAMIALVAVMFALVQSRRLRAGNPAIVGLTAGAAALMVAQVFIGAMNIWFELASWVSITHLGAATLVWGALVAATTLDAFEPVPESVTERRKHRVAEQRPASAIVSDYISALPVVAMAVIRRSGN